MIFSLISMIIKSMKENGVSSVYSMFNTVPPEDRSKGIYTLVGISSIEQSSPFFTYDDLYIPFKASAEIKVTAPKGFSMTELYDHYSLRIAPALVTLSGTNTSLKYLAAKYDSNINRLVLTAEFSISGITKVDRSEL